MTHPIVATIRSLLNGRNIPYTFMEHAPGVTSEDMVAIRKDFSLSEGAKALILRADGRFVQIVIPGDRKFSNRKARAVLGVRDIRFVTAEQLAEITEGVLPGAVPPFGNLFGLPVYADAGIFENERIVFNCGERTASIAMSPEDYRMVVQPTVCDVT